jgi:ribosomal protein S18 acetylase RimI-like enzyme
MVKLVPMQADDFAPYLEHGIREYAEEHVRNGNWQPDEALERSRKEFKTLLPDGLQSKDQYIFSIMDESCEQKLGLVWVEVKMDLTPRKGFIFDFVIDEQYRGQGFGKQALAALDERLIAMGVASVGLHVFAHNTNAFELYKKMGYEITNINMRKTYQ